MNLAIAKRRGGLVRCFDAEEDFAFLAPRNCGEGVFKETWRCF
jgi:hypothetical protein